MSPLPSYAQEFAAELQKLVPDEDRPDRAAPAAGKNRDGRAALAALRRGLGKAPGEAFDLYRYLGRWLATDDRERERAVFLIAPLFALHRVSWSADADAGAGRRNLGASFRRLARQAQERGGGASVEKRFVALLNCHRDDLPTHLRQAVSLLKAQEIPIDWAQLLVDVQGWGAESRWVQRDWARAFWRDDEPTTSNAPESESG